MHGAAWPQPKNLDTDLHRLTQMVHRFARPHAVAAEVSLIRVDLRESACRMHLLPKKQKFAPQRTE